MLLKSNENETLGPHLQFPKSVEPGKPKLGPLRPGWKRVRIGDLFTPAFRPLKMKDENIYDLVTVKRARGGLEHRECLKGSQISVKSQFLLKAGDFVTSNRQIVHGACGFVPKELDGSIVSNEYSILNCSPLILPEYLACLIHSKYFQQTCFHSSIGVHVEKMIFKLEDWFKWEIDIPPLEGQQSIADLISSVKDKEDSLVRKLLLVRQYSKELLNKVFMQEMRLGRQTADKKLLWEEVRLKDLAHKITQKNKDNSVSEVLTNSAKEGVVYQNEYFKKDIANPGNLDGYTVVEKDDFVYNPRISEEAPVGPIKRNHIGTGVMSPLYTVFRVKDKSLLDYLEQFFNTSIWHRYLHSVANFGARHDRMNITQADLFKLPVPLPSEQERSSIVKLMKSLSEREVLTKKELAKTRDFKIALIQRVVG